MLPLLFCVLAATLSVVATRTAIHRRHHAASASGPCTTGPIQCCDSTAAVDDPTSNALLALLGMSLQDTTGLIGFNCNPITTGGVSDPTCEQSPVCCENNNVGGLISMGCVPVVL